MFRARFALLLAPAVLPAASALAEPTRAWQSELGFTAQRDADHAVGGIRLFAGYVHPLSRLGARWSVYAAAGPYFELGVGTRIEDDGREPSRVSRLAAGAELRVGLAACRGAKYHLPGSCHGSTAPGHYTYLALTPLFANAEANRAIALAEEGGALGFRAALGFSLRSSWAFWWEVSSRAADSPKPSFGMFGVLGWLLPNTVELSLEHLRGGDRTTTRAGGALGYAF